MWWWSSRLHPGSFLDIQSCKHSLMLGRMSRVGYGYLADNMVDNHFSLPLNWYLYFLWSRQKNNLFLWQNGSAISVSVSTKQTKIVYTNWSTVIFGLPLCMIIILHIHEINRKYNDSMLLYSWKQHRCRMPIQYKLCKLVTHGHEGSCPGITCSVYFCERKIGYRNIHGSPG